MKKKKTIGMIGSSQIMHIVPILETEYEIVDISNIFEECKNKFEKLVCWVKSIWDVDVIYSISTDLGSLKCFFVAKCLGKKVISHWIGTDVYNAVHNKKKAKTISKFIDINFACFEALHNELKEVGIETVILPIIPTKMNFDLCEMPKEHAALVYMPSGREDFYGYQELKNIFPVFPDMEFHIVGTKNMEPFKQFENVIVEGVLTIPQMEEIYKKVSIIIRPTKHDGLSMSVLEALAKGKSVIWSCQFPFVKVCSTGQQIEDSLHELLLEEPQINEESHDFILANFKPEIFMKTFQTEMEKIFDET